MNHPVRVGGQVFENPSRNTFPHLKSVTCQNLEALEEIRKKDSNLFKEMLVSMAMLLQYVYDDLTMHILLGSLLLLQTARLPPHGTWCDHMSGFKEGFVFKT